MKTKCERYSKSWTHGWRNEMVRRQMQTANALNESDRCWKRDEAKVFLCNLCTSNAMPFECVCAFARIIFCFDFCSLYSLAGLWYLFDTQLMHTHLVARKPKTGGTKLHHQQQPTKNRLLRNVCCNNVHIFSIVEYCNVAPQIKKGSTTQPHTPNSMKAFIVKSDVPSEKSENFYVRHPENGPYHSVEYALCLFAIAKNKPNQERRKKKQLLRPNTRGNSLVGCERNILFEFGCDSICFAQWNVHRSVVNSWFTDFLSLSIIEI